MADAAPPPFRVSYPAPLLRRLLAWGDAAELVGLHSEYLAALRELRDRLESELRSFGDPVRNLWGMDGVLYRSLGRFFVTTYVVHNKQPIVLVQTVAMSPYSPLRAE